MISRRDFLQVSMAASALVGASGFGNWARLAAQQSLTQDQLLEFETFGNISLIHITDIHAQLKPIYFREPEVNLGILPGYGGTQRLVQYIGKTKAMELLLTADMIGADQALSLGLVNKVVEPEELVPSCVAMLQKIASKGPIAVAETIAAVNAYFDNQKNGFQVEADAFGRVADTEDFKEGAAAFVEKRKANFQGK